MLILAATDFSTRSNRALRQAGMLAQVGNVQLHVVHVVDDDQPKELVCMEKREAERLLNEQLNSMPELRGVQPRPMVLAGDPFDGILRAAAGVRADLIVMGSHRKQILLDIFIGTTIERVIRNGAFPILMVNNEAQRRYEEVLIPMDMSEASATALRIAESTGLVGERRTTLLHAFWPVAEGRMFRGVNQAGGDEYVASERQSAMDGLAAFLVANNLGAGGWTLRIEDGGVMEVISRAVAEMRPDLLVMGMHERSGLLRMFIGSVTEEALRSLNIDILVVPPRRR
ncbi:MAG TPA: universal stress protein [Candidatus Acidoferrales bacterium]|jgi:nucleotide-binding universal stress UspA family protein|nr:universal stress protein [Candidatus Acidoferrales bacterium]